MSAAGLGYRPLYQVVREALLARLIDGRWPPGTLLPTEQRLAAELGVSVGTVRKAVDALEAEHLVDRQQGRGTFVTVPDEGRLLFQFFRLAYDEREGRPPPVSVIRTVRKERAGAANSSALGISPSEKVWAIGRMRMLDDRPLITEEIYVPVVLFPDLDKETIPNSIYTLYSKRYQRTVTRAVEKLKSVAASKEDASVLECSFRAPLLLIDRTAYALDGTPVERRVSRCLTDRVHYLADLR